MTIVIYLYPGFTATDAVGPYEVLSRFPEAKVCFTAKKKGPVPTDYKFLKITADYSLEDIQSADILLIPGATYAYIDQALDKEVLTWVRQLHHTTKYTLSVCSGSYILGAAGVLKGLEATSHWAMLKELSKFGAKPMAQRYVRQGKIITAAGVSAGIDMALYLAGEEYGDAFARTLQLMIEYDPQPPFDSGSVEKASKATQREAIAFFKKDYLKMANGILGLLLAFVKLKIGHWF